MLIQIDGTFIFASISFIIFLIIMKLILFKPLSTVIDEREKFYEKNRHTVGESKQKAQKITQEKEQELSLTRAGAANLIKEVSIFANKNKDETIKNAKKEAGHTLNKTKEELGVQSENAKEELKGEINNFVKQIAFKVLQKDIEINLDEEKINSVIKASNGANNA